MTKPRAPQIPRENRPWWEKRRVGITPPAVGLLTCTCAWSSFLLTPAQTALTVVLVVIAVGVAADVRWGRKSDRPMRNFVWAVLVVFAVFVVMVRNQMVEMRWVFIILAACVLGLGGFWWFDNYNRHRVKIERDMERWPLLRQRLGLPMAVKRSAVQITETGRRWLFRWEPGTFTRGQLISMGKQLESAFEIPDGKIRFEDVMVGTNLRDSNAMYVTENTESAILKAPVTFHEPTMRKFTDEMFIGLREDGTEHMIVWYQSNFGGMHTLAGGCTGSGKSGLYHLVLAESAYCPDLVRWGIDAKGGMALRPWASLFDWMVDDIDTDETFQMLAALEKVLKARARYSAERGWQTWKPDSEHPILMLVVDEAAEVFGSGNYDISSLSETIGRMGRAAGVILLVATQHPTIDALGSTQLTKNLRRRFCFAVEDMHGQTTIVPKSAGVFDASDIPIGPDFVGTYYSSEGGLINNISGRVRYVTEHDIYRLIMAIGNDELLAVPGLDELSENAATEGSTDADGKSWYAERRIWTVDDAITPEDWPADEAIEPRIEHDPPLIPAQGSAAEPLVPAQADGARPDLRVVAGMGVPSAFAPHMPPAAREALTGTDGPFTTPKGAPPMTAQSISEVVTPQSPEEQAELDRALADYAARLAGETISAERAQGLLDEMLSKVGPGGISIAEMRKVLPRSSSWYGEQLSLRIESASVVKVSTGRYRAASRP